MAKINRKITITIKGDFGGKADVQLKAYEDGKVKKEWTVQQLSYTGLALLDFANLMLSECHQALMEETLKNK